MPKGHLNYWNPDRGFGRISNYDTPGTRGVFIHISELPHTPQPGDMLTYEIGSDRQGRECAVNVRPLSAEAEEIDRVFGAG
jgi:cold shock CspA family protein